jgi:hypothetical protein
MHPSFPKPILPTTQVLEKTDAIKGGDDSNKLWQDKYLRNSTKGYLALLHKYLHR